MVVGDWPKGVIMRSLERNKKTLYYALYDEHIPVKDEYGNETGETTAGYHNPVKIRARVGINRGSVEEYPAGILLDYTRTIVSDKKYPITETSILWVDTLPVFKQDGSTDTPPDYKVKRVNPDINVFSWDIQKQVK